MCAVAAAVFSTPAPAEKYFTLGDFPVRVAGMKVYHTADETCILETPVVWGSNAAVRGAPGAVWACPKLANTLPVESREGINSQDRQWQRCSWGLFG